MNQIQRIDVTKLHTDESLGFLSQVLTYTDLVSVQADSEVIKKFNTSVKSFEDALKPNIKNSYTDARKQADEVVDKLWSGANMYCESMTFHPDNNLTIVANKICDIFDKYGRITKMSYKEQYPNLNGLINELNDNKEDIAKLSMKEWVNALSQAYDDFIAITKDKLSEDAQREVGIVQDSRDNAEEAYNNLINRVNAGASYNGVEPYEKFMDSVNVVIDEYKALLSSRKTRNKNKDK